MSELFVLMIFILILPQLHSCGTIRHVGSATDTTDTTYVQVHEETNFVKDTVFIKIPPVFVEKEVKDTISHIERDNVSTVAKIGKDGTLYHNLEIKQTTVPIPFLKPVIKRDSSTTTRNVRNTTQVVEVPRKLTWFQQTQIYGFWALLALFAVILLVKRFFR